MGHWLDEKRIGAATGINYTTMMLLLLRNAGFPEKIIPYLLAQTSHESNSGASNLAKFHNNYSGIRCNNRGHTSGCIDVSGPFAKKDLFATYATPANWASDYKRVLSMAPARPIDAVSAEDFYQRLLKNAYFTKAESKAYATAFNSRLREVNRILQDNNKDLATSVKNATQPGQPFAPGGANTPDTGKGKVKPMSSSAFQFFKDHPLATGAGIAIVGLLVVKSISR